MTTRTVTAMFNTRAEADTAAQQLSSELGVARSAVRTSAEGGAETSSYSSAPSGQDTGFLASLKNLFLPEEDRYAYEEGVRRGNVLVTATIDENQVDRACAILENAGAVDLDQQEESWRQSGWSGYSAPSAATTSAAAGALGTSPTLAGTAGVADTSGLAGVAPTSVSGSGLETGASARAFSDETARRANTGSDQVIPVVEERLVVGKREVGRGSVRVRSYVVERPVEQQVTLHEERVDIDRRPVDRALTEDDRAAAFQERTIEATARSEEAVVGKEARVVEEIAIHKEASDRTETVRDTVRKTEVEVEDGKGVATGGTATTRSGSGTLSDNAATRATDRTLNTNVSGTNPGADAPDGTPGNPPGTMASRAVDKTLGTNISGANPGRKS